MSKKTISITEGRKNLFKITEEVQKPNTYYTFTVDGRPQAVILSAEEFDSIMETMEILSDPEAMANIEKAEEEYRRGDYITLEEFKEELGYNNTEIVLVRDKPKSKYKASKDCSKRKKK